MINTHLQTRRDCLRQIAGGLTLAAGLSPLRSRLWADEKTTAEKLIVRQEKPFNAEPALADLLTDWQTPIGTFFRRNHGTIPDIAWKDHRLTIEGLVERPITLAMEELVSIFPTKHVFATLTCAGNRRSEFPPEPKISGVQWTGAAIGNAEWSGVRLAEVLQHAGVKAEAKHVWFDGLDEITEGDKKFSFGASIPIDKAMSRSPMYAGCLLAFRMNRTDLPREHGGPLRGVIPGYIGARSVKWLSKITVSDRPSPNHYVADVYKLVQTGALDEAHPKTPIYEHALNSVACRLTKQDQGWKVSGFALPTGKDGCIIQRVELSLDNGETWFMPEIVEEPPRQVFCWTFWQSTLPKSAAGKTLLVRAVDTSGASQPREFPYNFKGYQYNGWHALKVDV